MLVADNAMARSTRGEGAAEPVEYYVAVPGIPGTALALLAGRGAILAHRRFRGHPGYARWHDGSMAKVMLRAASEELVALARAHDGLALPEEPDVPRLAVFRPRPKDRAQFLAHLKLYSGRVAWSTRAEWPQSDLHVPVLLNGELDLSAGKLAAQVAHAVLVLQEAWGTLAVWADWLATGTPLALLKAPERLLVRLVEEGRAWGVQDEGRTEIAAGSLTAAATPPGTLDAWRAEPEMALLAHDVWRPVAAKELPRPS